MELLEIKVMRGPNMWSKSRRKLMVMKINVGEWEERPTHMISGFGASLVRVLPTLKTHRFSEGYEGGFLERVNSGIGLQQVIVHLALELQRLAGIGCGLGQTRPTNVNGVYHVLFSYVTEKAGIYAGQAAFDIVQHLLNGTEPQVDVAILELQRLYNKEKLGPTSFSIVKEAELRNIPYTRLNQNSLVMLGQGCHQKTICASVASTTSSLAVNLASDKDATRRLLQDAHIPVPNGTLISALDELEEAINDIGFPLVTKPVDGNHGRGITTRINTMEEARLGFIEALKISEDVIVEQYITGTDYRFLVINFKLVAVAERTPAMVTGDGTSTINDLVNDINRHPTRGEGHEKALTTIKLDEGTDSLLLESNLTLHSVLPFGDISYLKETANLSTGGTSRDVTDMVHPDNVAMAERIARVMNLDICGIDIMAQAVDIPITQKNGGVLEVNAGPGFRMHLSPVEGKAINVAEPLIDMLFPDYTNGRIPIVAVTGTNGKTTVTRLIAHMAQAAGHHTGYTTTDGIYIDGTNICYGDCSGPESAVTVLRDPLVEFAVLETARGGILRSGLGFDKCDISIVTNVTDDHLGLNGIDTIEQLARVKAVVPQSTSDQGYAVLNADDDLVYNMRHQLNCNIALFSMDAYHPRILQHCENGGWAAYIKDDYFVIRQGEVSTKLAKVSHVPLTFSGTCEFMIKNVLPAVLAASLSNFPLNTIIEALKSFIPSPALTPGRMNEFQFKDFRVMIDYVHNTDGYIQMKKYLDQDTASKKTGIIGATGDRRVEDIKNIGRQAAQMFDSIIIRHDRDNRDRTPEELSHYLTEGIKEINATLPVLIISDEIQSIQYAIDHAEPGELIFMCADDIKNLLAYVQQQVDIEKLAVDVDLETLNTLPL